MEKRKNGGEWRSIGGQKSPRPVCIFAEWNARVMNKLLIKIKRKKINTLQHRARIKRSSLYKSIRNNSNNISPKNRTRNLFLPLLGSTLQKKLRYERSRESNCHSAHSTTLDTLPDAFSGSINFVHERGGGEPRRKRRMRWVPRWISAAEYGARLFAFDSRACSMLSLKCENTATQACH